jgi:hypothetical protein
MDLPSSIVLLTVGFLCGAGVMHRSARIWRVQAMHFHDTAVYFKRCAQTFYDIIQKKDRRIDKMKEDIRDGNSWKYGQ